MKDQHREHQARQMRMAKRQWRKDPQIRQQVINDLRIQEQTRLQGEIDRLEADLRKDD